MRLLSVGLVDAMSKLSSEDLSQVETVHFHKVIDNAEYSLSADDFWIHLNFHLMHFLDFLPAAAWKRQLGEPLFQLFVELFRFLERHGKIQCNVDFSLASPGEEAGADEPAAQLPLTLGMLVSTHVPKRLARALAAKAVRKYSRECRHSLRCAFEFKDARKAVLVND